MVSVFPHLLTRTATGRFTDFDALRWAELPALLASGATLQARQSKLQAQLTEALYLLIQHPDWATQATPLLRLKRAVFNSRPLPAPESPALAGLPPATRAALADYTRTRAELTAWEQAVERAYEQHLLLARAHLQGLAQQESLLKGLLLSSEVLLTQLPRYWQTAPADFRKREYHLELGLLRYLSRLHFKTSPFSTFTAVGLSTLGAVPNGVAWPPGEVPCRSILRLNNNLLAYLKTLLLLVPALRDALPVYLNPSLTQQADGYHFLLNHHNVEAFQKLPRQELLAAVETELAAAGGQVALAQLAQILAADYVDAPAPALLDWLLKLLACGFLEMDFGASGTDPNWDQALTRRLQPLAATVPVAGEVLTLLQRLRHQLATYAVAPARDRVALHQQIRAAFRYTEAQLLAAGGQEFSKGLSLEEYRQAYARQYQQDEAFEIQPFLHADFGLFYEDAAQPTAGQLDADLVLQFVQSLQGLLAGSARPEEEPAAMRTYFLSRYEPARAVPLLVFYQAYVADVRKPAQEQAERAASPSGTTAEPPWLAAWLAESLPAYAPAVTLHPPPLEALRAGQEPVATAAYVQFFTEAQPGGASQLRGVVNGLSAGLGRGSGRFLHLFGPEVPAAFQAWNHELPSQPALVAELTDASYSNANLHPPLLPWQLVLPGGHATHPAAQQLSARDLTVRYCGQSQQIGLWNEPSGRLVLPHDVGLQALATRSELYQFLTHFGGVGPPSLTPLLRAVGQYCRARFPQQTQPQPGVFRYPRIEGRAGVVLQRRRWYVPPAGVPVRGSVEGEGRYLLRLAEWRQQLELPAEVFYYLRPTGEVPATAAPAGADDYKPQYLHFENPLLVRLFAKQLPKAGNLLLLEEMYPDTATLRRQAQHHVRESLVEWRATFPVPPAQTTHPCSPAP